MCVYIKVRIKVIRIIFTLDMPHVSRRAKCSSGKLRGATTMPGDIIWRIGTIREGCCLSPGVIVQTFPPPCMGSTPSAYSEP